MISSDEFFDDTSCEPEIEGANEIRNWDLLMVDLCRSIGSLYLKCYKCAFLVNLETNLVNPCLYYLDEINSVDLIR